MSDDIKLLTIQPDDHERVLDFLRAHYYTEEPLTVGTEPKEQDPEDEKFNMSNITNGMCLMAVRADEPHTVVGAVLAGPKGTDEAAHILEEADRLGATKWGHTLRFLAGVERDADVWTKYNVTKALHMHVLAVDRRERGKAIGKRLVQQMMQVAKAHGYPLLTADCTSVYSAALCERLAMDCVCTTPYADYVNDKGEQVIRPPPPHTATKTYAIRL